MLVRIWGCRGSIPVATNTHQVRRKLTRALLAASGRTFATESDARRFVETELPWSTANAFGGNTSCVEIETDADSYLLCDMGSGLREFGQKMMATHGPGNPQTYNFLMSHFHWDHIMGFPFFIPAYIPGNIIRIFACHPDPESAMRIQHSAPHFPVDYSMLGAAIEYVSVVPGESFEVDGTTVVAAKQYHGGDSYGYRLQRGGKVVVYSTDSEHKQENQDEIDLFLTLFKDADVVVFDAQYSLAEMQTLKQDWGHSSNIIGVELCQQAGAKHLVLFHHEPSFDDDTLHGVFQETVRYEEIMREGAPLKVSSAYDGLEIQA